MTGAGQVCTGWVGEGAELGQVSPLQNDGPLPLNTIAVTDGSSRATLNASRSAARASVENALCRCGRLNRIRSIAVALDGHRIGDVRYPRRAALLEPPREFGARLQRRVRQ